MAALDLYRPHLMIFNVIMPRSTAGVSLVCKIAAFFFKWKDRNLDFRAFLGIKAKEKAAESVGKMMYQ